MIQSPEPGDIITAKFLRELADARDKVQRLMNAVGQNGLTTSAIAGVTGLPVEEIAFVTMNRDSYTVDDARFADPAYDPQGEENAEQMEYDAGAGDFVQVDGSGRKLMVVAAGGVVPKEGDQLWVRYSARGQVWVPLVSPPNCNAWIRIPDGSQPDAEGWILAWEDVWDEPSQTWIQTRQVYVRDANW